MFKKVLVANRGEIAVRVMRTCRDLGIRSVAVYSEADRTALHARYADEAYCIGPAPAPQSYLNIEAVIEAARKSGAQAIHPGYGFLSERSEFVRACNDAGITFIGPPEHAVQSLGDKVEARRIAEKAGAPTVPGTSERVGLEEARQVASRIGFPLLIKAAAGGGGKGIRLVNEPGELEPALRLAASEAEASFGDAGLYVEKYLDPVRHIEVQVLADRHGNAIHLGERECSLQRRSQKLVEESPSAVVDPELRRRLGAAAVAIAQTAGYENAGTVEFLVDAQGNFYFIEVNARLQVEHPVTELVTGLDLIHEQLRLAAGEPLRLRQEHVELRGWAIECRVTAEDASKGFLPSLGRVSLLSEPSGPGVRVDSSLFPGMEVAPYYDSLLAKVIAWGADRQQATARLLRALNEYQVLGVQTTIPFYRQLIESEAFRLAAFDTRFLERRYQAPATDDGEATDEALIAAALLSHQRKAVRPVSGNGATADGDVWRAAARAAAIDRGGGPGWRSTS